MKIGKVSFKKEHRQETIIYLALWLLMFMAPVLSLGIRTAYNENISFDWSEVMRYLSIVSVSGSMQGCAS